MAKSTNSIKGKMKIIQHNKHRSKLDIEQTSSKMKDKHFQNLQKDST